jgi:tRNA (mo5U34)-methyltransferase
MAQSSERIAAGDRGFEQRIQKLAGQVQARFRYHSIDLPDGSVLPGLQSLEHLRWRLGLFGLPNDLRGQRVLDIGAWDGWFSFECERRGAEVVAVDCVVLDTFLEAKRLIGSRVEYLTLDVAELSARRLGRFDIVLFFGVLYHLRHPLLGLEKAVELSTGIALVESFVIAPEHRGHPAVMEYYERAELGGQIDNWCGPSPECLLSFCRSAGFAQAELLDITNSRASVLCKRHWPAPDANPSAAPPQLRAAVNNRSYEAIFHPLKDEYLLCFFNSAEENLTPDSVFVEVDGYGTQLLVVAGDGSGDGNGGWQANCLRPPGLDPGWHEVRVRTARGGRSNTAAFTMLDEFGRDVLAPAAALPLTAPEMCSAELRVSGDSRYASQRDGYLVCYFRSPAQTVMPGDVTIEAGGHVLQAQTISPLEPGVWQANVALNEPLAAETPVRVRLGEGEWSAATPACARR